MIGNKPMRRRLNSHRLRRGHTLIELVTATVSSAILLAGLGSVTFIASQVANTPAASTHRLESASAINELTNDARFATYLVERSAHVLDFIVADRSNDGTAERIRYAWSGVPGEPLFKTVNGGTAMPILAGVQDLQFSVTTRSAVTSFTTTTDSADTLLATYSSGSSSGERDVHYTTPTAGQFISQRIDPTTFSGVPGSATQWNLSRIEFQGQRSGSTATENLRVQLRSSGEPAFRPTSEVLGEVVMPEGNLSSSTAWNTATFASPIRGLPLHRAYDIVWSGTLGESGNAAKITYYDVADSNVRHVNETTDGGTTWTNSPDRRVLYRVYGTCSSPGATYNVTRTYATRINITLQSATLAHSRVTASVPLLNEPELLSAYWRTDFDRNPTTDDVTRDGTNDWVTGSGGAFVGLTGGIWTVSGTIESRPKNNFTSVTTVEARLRNTGVGGNGAVLRLQADRQGGTHAPLEVRLQKQSDLSQTLTLYGKSNDATDVMLFQRKNLSSDFVRVRLTILPASNVVNLAINDVDEGTYTYPIYAPSNDNRFLTAFADTSSAEYDYVEIRVAE
jgi:hypothetical protein